MTTAETTEPPVAVVTGASSGIGAATARRLAEDGWRVHALARRADRLDELVSATDRAAGDLIPHTADVRAADDLTALLCRVGQVDVLVNNAGLGRAGFTLADSALDDITRSVDTNVTALLVATRAVLPAMIERRRGHIVNIGSMAGLYPTDGAIYGATKAAVNRVSTNLRLELRGTGVRVTEICPGRVTTEFYDVAIDDPHQRAVVQDSGVAEVTADDVADTIAYAVSVPRHVNINRIELQPTEQTYGGTQFDPTREPDS
jgi:3-hydroxy acid dehydrogenase/malonic semialdehyde reductase